ncbi:GIY-YIG nuclease family protein [Halobacillus sp. A5]|uniref:GIY-YIG nuclease family protein n=1 Tax=Halobacillus sp. A5 TaxID=2880263 RepID=UPI0020A6683E|nr:GIY-YIG nuclease family protein [Halobacillus sp. A5]MCP3029711.1 GIY-YIG nuclease family protein [Halobacillus sp. A5]
MAGNHYVYIIRCKDQTLYTGYTNDLSVRLKKHVLGKGAKYTRGRGPFSLEYCQQFNSKTEAMQQEYRIKQWSRLRKETWILEQEGGLRNEYSKELLQP